MSTPRKVLYIVRGLPGSGKSTLARCLAPRANAANDDYFYGPNGYSYDASKHEIARAQCLRRITDFMKQDHPAVAVHNTFIRHVSYASYMAVAKRLGYEVVIVSLSGDLGSVHAVPSDVMASMARSWEP